MKNKKIISVLKKIVEGMWPGIVDMMFFVETEPQKIKRWKRVSKERPWYVLRKGRQQNVLQHSNSLGLLGETILIMIEDSLDRPLDSRLLQLCFKVHDLGEPLLKRDICCLDKKESDDSDEYIAFSNKIKYLPEKVQEKYKEAFLLQFCLSSNISFFPVDAIAIMEGLMLEKRDEAIFFRAVENIEYFSFAIEQMTKKGALDYFVTVCKNQFKNLDNCVELLPALHLVWNENFKHNLNLIYLVSIEENQRLFKIR